MTQEPGPRRVRGRRDITLERHVGRAMRDLRERHGLSREDMAQRMGVSSQQLRKLEEATVVIPVARLQAAAQALGVSVGDFFPVDDLTPAPPDPSPMDHPQTRALIEAYYMAPDTVRASFSALLASLSRR